LLLGILACGCKKKLPPSEMEAGAASPADAAEEASAADTGAGDDGPTGAADAAPAAEDGSAQGDDGGGGPSTVATGVNYSGSYNCFGTLTLRQVGSTVAGDAVAHQGGKTLNNDLTCNVSGDRCSGQMNHFKTKAGGAPKPEGRTKITLRIVAGGLEYTEGNGGSGFCKRN